MALSESERAQVEAVRATRAETRRVTAPALEAILHEAVPVLDHGFVRVVDYMGDDSAVVQAARVSYGAGTRRVHEDRGLIRYLMRHHHTTPFEMCEIKLHVKLPIFVARQWIRHRTANVNEYSARYSILDREFYVPAPDKVAAQSASNRQGRGATLEGAPAEAVRRRLADHGRDSFDLYHALLDEDDSGTAAEAGHGGVARELARIAVPLAAYTQWYWKIDLHNLLHFVALRIDRHAQYEIRAYADAIAAIVARWVPVTYEAFTDYRLHAAALSRGGLDAVRRMLDGEAVTADDVGLSAREWRELMATLGRQDPSAGRGG